MPFDAAAVSGFIKWREIEGEFLEVPGLTRQQAQDRRARSLAVDALLEDVFAGKGGGRRRPHASAHGDRVLAIVSRERSRDA